MQLIERDLKKKLIKKDLGKSRVALVKSEKPKAASRCELRDLRASENMLRSCGTCPLRNEKPAL